MYMTAVASMAPPQPTPTPFPTLDLAPRGKIVYIDLNMHVLHVMDGNGNNDISTIVEAGDQPTWSPDGKNIVMTCSSMEDNVSISQLCFYDTAYLGTSDANAHVIKMDISQTTQNSGFISSYSWSPDSQHLIVLLDYVSYRKLCTLTIKTRGVDCSTSNYILNGFSNDDLQIFRSATSVAWSPTNQNLIAIAVPSFSSGRILLGDLVHHRLAEISFPVTLFDLGDSIAWSPDGKQIAFTHSGTTGGLTLAPVCQNSACLLYPPGPILGVINIDGTNYKKIVDGVDIFYRWPLGKAQYDFPPISTYGQYYKFDYPSWSPDGRFLTFVAKVSPFQHMIYTEPFRVDLNTGYFIHFEFNSIPNWSH